MLLVLAVAIGIVAGLRSMTAPAVIAWASRLGWLTLDGTPMAFLASTAARWVLTALMIGELIADKLPFTPSRTTVGPFAGRLIAGGLSGAALLAGHGGSGLVGAVLGAVGGVIGTMGGYRARTGLVRRLGVPDYVVAVGEDLVAIGGAFLIAAAARS
jgi:uncharacterized membrane protein